MTVVISNRKFFVVLEMLSYKFLVLQQIQMQTKWSCGTLSTPFNNLTVPAPLHTSMIQEWIPQKGK